MKFVGICSAAALGAASAAGAAETEIYLEEGHVEVQLANGGFIGLAGGADFSILHDETGAPDLIDVRGGAIQLMSAFLDPEPFLVQIGGLTMRMGAGSSVLSVNGDGVVSVLVLNGDGVTVSGPGGDALIGAGTMMIAPPGGEMRTATMTAEALRAQAGAFMGAPPAGTAAANAIGGVAAGSNLPKIAVSPPKLDSLAGPGEAVRDAARDVGRRAVTLPGGGGLVGGGNGGGGGLGGGGLGGGGLGGGGLGGGGGGGLPNIPNPPDPPDPPKPPEFPQIVVDVFNKLPPGQLDDLDNLPKRFQELVDDLTPEQRKLLEQLIALQG